MDSDSILKQFGLKFEDLNATERETYTRMLGDLQKSVLTIERLRDYIAAMRQGVIEELTQCDLGNKKDLFLKARLRNYTLLEAFLLTPEKAKKQLEIALKGVR